MFFHKNFQGNGLVSRLVPHIVILDDWPWLWTVLFCIRSACSLFKKYFLSKGTLSLYKKNSSCPKVLFLYKTHFFFFFVLYKKYFFFFWYKKYFFRTRNNFLVQEVLFFLQEILFIQKKSTKKDFLYKKNISCAIKKYLHKEITPCTKKALH